MNMLVYQWEKENKADSQIKFDVVNICTYIKKTMTTFRLM